MSEERLMRIENKIDTVDQDIDELKAQVTAINVAMAKQRGFVAGFSAAFTFLGATIAGLALYIWHNVIGQ